PSLRAARSRRFRRRCQRRPFAIRPHLRQGIGGYCLALSRTTDCLVGMYGALVCILQDDGQVRREFWKPPLVIPKAKAPLATTAQLVFGLDQFEHRAAVASQLRIAVAVLLHAYLLAGIETLLQIYMHEFDESGLSPGASGW